MSEIEKRNRGLVFLLYFGLSIDKSKVSELITAGHWDKFVSVEVQVSQQMGGGCF